MANILRGYGLAREQAHFKMEQEADVQRHRQRLVKEGKLEQEAQTAAKRVAAAAARQQAGSGQPFESSEHTYEVLAEVLQQQARLDAPNALRRKQFERRVKGEAPPLTEAELQRARGRLMAVGAAVGHVPRMSMGRNRWQLPADSTALAQQSSDAALAAIRQLSPEAREVASRTYAAGVRALVYGSLLGAIGLAGAGTYAVRSLGIHSGEDLGDLIRAGMAPISHNMRAWLLPFKHWAEEWVGPPAAGLSTGQPTLAAVGLGSGVEAGAGGSAAVEAAAAGIAGATTAAATEGGEARGGGGGAWCLRW